MRLLRTEDWTREADWGISTAVVEVFEGEQVFISYEIAREFDISPDEGRDVARFEKFVLLVPYARVAQALGAQFYVKQDPVDASA